MINPSLKFCILLLLTTFLSACNGLFDTDNTPPPAPLTALVQPEINPTLRFSIKTGIGANDQYLKLKPALANGAIFTTDVRGVVSAVDKNNGNLLWQTTTYLPLTTGPAAGEGFVVAGSSQGDIIALAQADGKIVWQKKIIGELLASPAIADGMAVIKTTDGYITGLSLKNGQERWASQQIEPGFILRGASAPVISQNSLFAGFSSGNLFKFALDSGEVLWRQTIAYPSGTFAISRMVDIDTDPLVLNQRVYAATYQGKIVALDWDTGSILWSHDLSSYTGMATDGELIAITDAKGLVWAFNAKNGQVAWLQNKLHDRRLSGVAFLGGFIVVGDGQGYIHWLDTSDGHIAARSYVGNAIYTAPIAKDNNLYVYTKNGYLLAYRLPGQ